MEKLFFHPTSRKLETATLKHLGRLMGNKSNENLHDNLHGMIRGQNNNITILQMEHLFSAPFSPQVMQNSASMNPTCPVMACVSTDKAVGSLPWGAEEMLCLS